VLWLRVVGEYDVGMDQVPAAFNSRWKRPGDVGVLEFVFPNEFEATHAIHRQSGVP